MVSNCNPWLCFWKCSLTSAAENSVTENVSVSSSSFYTKILISGYTEIEAIEGREAFLPCMTSLSDVSSLTSSVVRMTDSVVKNPSPSSVTGSTVGGRSKNIKNNNNNKVSSSPISREEPALIIWYRGSSGIPIFTVDARNASKLSDSTQISSSEYEGRVEFDPRLVPPALRIKTIYVEDEGEYRCRCDFRKSRSQNFLLNLTVIGKFWKNRFPVYCCFQACSIPHLFQACLLHRRKIDLRDSQE